MPITPNEIQDILNNATPGPPPAALPSWTNRNNQALRAFLVTADRMRGHRGFNYGDFETVFQCIDLDVYSPLHQVRCLRWGSSASDLCNVLVFVNALLMNYLEKILVVIIPLRHVGPPG